MKISNWLSKATKTLSQAGIPSARLDCLIMLSDCLNQNKAWLLANLDIVLKNTELKILTSQLRRREAREPLAYIRCKSEFYGNQFLVNKDVLIPRPESEDLVQEALSISNESVKVLDVGTGSGAVAISIALNSGCGVSALDISAIALSVAKRNAKNLNANVDFYQNDLLNNVSTRYEIIIANLPYVSKGMKKDLQTELSYEPEIALWVDGDGLDLYRKLFFQIKNMLFLPQHVITESLVIQHKIMQEIADDNGYKIENIRGLVQHFTKNHRNA